MVHNEQFSYSRDWERDGYLLFSNTQTMGIYERLRYHTNFDCMNNGVFSAIDDESYKDGLSSLEKAGFINAGDKVYALNPNSRMNCFFGTQKGIEAFKQFYKDKAARIKEECDPVEVFAFEYNNYECMYGGIEEPFEIIKYYFGDEGIERVKSKMRGLL